MNTRQYVLALILALAALASCREITVTTKINKDGSFTRILKVTGDSSEVFKMDLPYPVDSTWAREVQKDTSSKEGYTITYTKYYPDCSLLNMEIRRDTSWMHSLNREVTVSKKFGFFYSYFIYREVYPAANPFRLLDFRKYVTAEDLSWLAHRNPVTSPADSTRVKEAEDRAMAFLVGSAAAEVEQILKESIRKLNDPDLVAGDVPKFHDSILEVIRAWKFSSADELITHYRNWTGNPAAERLRELSPRIFAGLDQKGKFIDALLSLQDFREEAELPGLITGTNSNALKGNLVGWDVSPMAFLLEDYVMFAESRVINLWAFIVSGLVLLALVILLVVRVTRN